MASEDTIPEELIIAQLDQGWAHAEEYANVYMQIGAGVLAIDDPRVRDLVMKACALVGVEADRRKRMRQSQ